MQKSTQDGNLDAALTVLEDTINQMSGENDRQVAVRKWFGRMHRTLQQAFVRTVVLPILQQLDYQYANGFYDARNQASVDLAHKMLSATELSDTYLPFI